MEEKELYLRVDDEEDEREIDFGLLFVKLIKQWKVILIAGIIFAICLVGFNYMNSLKNYSQVEEDVSIDSLEDALTPEEYTNVISYISIFDKLGTLQQQNSNRLQYQLDPYNKESLYLTYAIKLKDDVESDNIGKEIARHLSDSTIVNQLSGVYCNHVNNFDWYKEIKTLTKNIDHNDLNTLIRCNYSNGVVTIQITNTEDVDIKAIADIIKNDLELFANDQQGIAEHELLFTEESYRKSVDNDLVTTQLNMSNQIYNMQNQLIYLENNLDDAEKKYIETYLKNCGESNVETDDNVNVTDDNIKPHFSKKMAVAGFAVGILLVCFCELIKYLFSDKLHSEGDLTEYLHLQIYGHQSMKEKVVPKGIDGLIYKLENHNKKILTPSEQKEIIISGIRLYCEQKNLKEIVLTGTDIENIDKEYIESVKDNLNKAGVKVLVEKNIYYYPEALQNCVKIPNAVLFETIESSVVKEIENVLLKAKEYNINVLGAVVMEQ